MRKSAATGHPPYYAGPAGPRLCSPGPHPASQGSFPGHGAHFGGTGSWPGHGSGPSMGYYPPPSHEPYASSSQVAFSGYHGSQASLNSAYYGYHANSNPPLYPRPEPFPYPSAGPAAHKDTSQDDSSADSIEAPCAPPKRAATSVKLRSFKPKSSQSTTMPLQNPNRPEKDLYKRKGGRPFKAVPLKTPKPLVLVSVPPPPASPPAVETEEMKSILKPTARRRPNEAKKPKKPKKAVAVKITPEPEAKASTAAPSRPAKRTVTEYEEYQEIQQQAKKLRSLTPSKRKARSQSKISTLLARGPSSNAIKKCTKKIVLGPTLNASSMEDASTRPTQGTQPIAGAATSLNTIVEVGVVSCANCKEVEKVLQHVQVKLEQLAVTVDTLKVAKSTPPRRPSTPLKDLPVDKDGPPEQNENSQANEFMDLDGFPISKENSQDDGNMHSTSSTSSQYLDLDEEQMLSDSELSLDQI